MILKYTVTLLLLFGAISIKAQNVFVDLPDQYKKYHPVFAKQIIDGSYVPPDDSEGDGEDMFIKASGFAALGQYSEAMPRVMAAVDRGLPAERFFAGPRNWLSGLTATDEFKAWNPDIELIHGPMLGDVTGSGVKVWARTFNEVPVAVLIGESSDLTGATTTDPVSTDSEMDYTVVIDVTGLKPGTEYFYKLVVNDVPDIRTFSFRTTQPRDKRVNFTIGFGGGSGYTPNNLEESGPTNNERMWDIIDEKKFSAFFLIGDFIYHDANDKLDLQSYFYYRRHSQAEWRNFAGGTPLYGTWDDHDFRNNDYKFPVSPSLEDNPWKLENWKLFRNQWANPYYGGGDATQGVYYDFHMNGVDFFFIDGRYWRFHDDSTMLGPQQKQWLKDKLTASEGIFKVIVSNVPVSEGAKPGSNDTWDGFPKEREEILSFIEDNKIDGVFFVASDRHRSDHWTIGRPASGVNGEINYSFQEYMSSRLTNEHVHPVIGGAEYGYNNQNSFGTLIFDMESSDPSVTYTITNISDEEVYSNTVLHSEMMRIPGDIGLPVGVKPGKKIVQAMGSNLGVTLVAGKQTRFIRFNDLVKNSNKYTSIELRVLNTQGAVLQKHTLQQVDSKLIEFRLDTSTGKFPAGQYVLRLQVDDNEYGKVFSLL